MTVSLFAKFSRGFVFALLMISAGLVSALLPRFASAIPMVTYTATDVIDSVPGEDRWQYEYSIHGPVSLFEVIEIVFGPLLYADLAVSNPSAGVYVDTFFGVIQPDPFVGPGFGDGLVDIELQGGIAPGSSETVTVEFIWLGTGIPGSQDFLEFGTNEIGQTAPAVSAVPEPQLALLLGAGCLLLVGRRRPAIARLRRVCWT